MNKIASVQSICKNYIEKTAKNKEHKGLQAFLTSTSAIPGSMFATTAYAHGVGITSKGENPANLDKWKSMLNNAGYQEIQPTSAVEENTSKTMSANTLLEYFNKPKGTEFTNNDGKKITLNLPSPGQNILADEFGPHYNPMDHSVNMPTSWSNNDGIFAHELGHALRDGKADQTLLHVGNAIGGAATTISTLGVGASELLRHSKLVNAKSKKEADLINKQHDKISGRTALGGTLLGGLTVPGEFMASWEGMSHMPENASFMDKLEAFQGLPTYALLAATPALAYGASKLINKNYNYNYKKNKKEKNND